jgi:hypothetical protein
MTETASTGPLLPTAEDENRFWALVEEAWSQVADETVQAARRALASRPPVSGDTEDELGSELLVTVDSVADDFIQALTGLAAELSAAELTALDRVVERKLYDIDREDVHDVTDGSDDGFLYARGFIVAAGREYYHAVVADPRLAVPDCDLEAMCYLFAHLHDRKFGDWPRTGSGISRETCGNPAGWSSD